MLGRFISRDPLSAAEFREGSNLYAYVGNNPVNWVDPTGLITECERKKLKEDLEDIAFKFAAIGAGLGLAASVPGPHSPYVGIVAAGFFAGAAIAGGGARAL